METLWNDIRHALRMFRASPGLTAVAVLSLAIGIGPNAAVFSLIDGLGFRPLPIRDPASLLLVSSATPKDRSGEASYAEYLELRDGVPAFAGVAAQATQGVSISGGTQGPSLGFADEVSANYFATLGVAPVAGRTFLSEEDQTPGTHPVAIISERLWIKRYGRDPQVLGRTIRLNRVDCAIVGVMPAAFRGMTPPNGPDVWVPLLLSSSLRAGPGPVTDSRGWRRLTLFARLAPQATLSQARAVVDALASHLAQAYPDTNRDRRFTIEYEEAQRRGSFTSVALISLAVVGLVLLIACANVAGLLLGRSEARRGEIAMRLALGATRGRLVRQLLTESAVLSLMAAAAGLALTFGMIALLPALVPPTPVTLSFDFRLDPRVLAFTLTVALLAAPVFGLAPALLASRRDILPVLKGDSGASRFGWRRFHPRTVLVVGQIAVSLALLASSGLMLRSYFNTYRIDPGFVPRPMIFCTLAPQTVGYNDVQSRDLYRRLLDRLAAVPGVERVSMASNLPLDSLFGGGAKLKVAILGHEPPAGEEAFSFRSSVVEPGYFDTMGIRLLKGRDFAAGDRTGAAGAVIVNQTFARRFWPQGDPIGQGIRLLPQDPGGSVTEYQIVGVVQDVKHLSFGETPAPYVYRPFAQAMRGQMTVIVRGPNEASMAAAFRRELGALDRAMPALLVTTIGAHLRLASIAEQAVASILSVVSGIGLFLSTIGLYGVISFFVMRDRREIGIRIALGARPADVVARVLTQGGRLAVVGSVIGLGLAAAAGRLLRGALYGVSGTDPIVFGIVTCLVIGVALAASYLPARRAAAVDPAVTLRRD
jgi:putative ABC transport system permease protein